MTRAWWDGPLVGFDLETTAPDPFEARIVSAAVVVCSRDGIEERTWLADPGVPIPEEATAVHGITTERAQTEGRDPGGVVREVLEALYNTAGNGLPLIAFNARYDLTVMDCEGRRYLGALGALASSPRLRVVDPAVLDKWLDRYRKSYPPGHDAESAKAAGIPSSRTLEGMCAHYGVTLDGAHDAAFDAIAACRLAYRIGAHADVVRRVRGRGDVIELKWLRARWAVVRGDLDRLHVFQRELAIEERARFADYKRSIGEHKEAERIASERGWPVLELAEAAALAEESL